MKAEVISSRLKGNALRYRPVLFVILALNYLAYAYLQLSYLSVLLSVVCLICLLLCLPHIKSSSLIVGLILFLSGIVLLILADAGLELWLNSIIINANLITLLILVPLFGLPLSYGGYSKVLDALAGRYMNSSNRVYWTPALLTHFFGAFMNIGALPVVYQLVIPGKLSPVFHKVPAAILRGFCSSIYWSPNMISVAVVTHYLHVSWADFARTGIVFAVLSLLAGWLVHIITELNRPKTPASVGGGFQRAVKSSMDSANIQRGLNPPLNEVSFKVKNKGDVEPSTPANTELTVDRKKLSELLFFSMTFLGIIVIIATRTTIPVLNAVPLLALVYPIFWLGLLGKANKISCAYKDYIKHTLPGFSSEIVIFMGAGFVATAILASGGGAKISLLVSELIGLNTYLLCFFIASSIILSAVLGITPMVTVMVYSVSLDPALIGLSPQLLSLVLVGGWATGVIVSPFTGVTLIMSGLTQKTSFRIARENWLFGIIMVLLLSAVPLMLNYF
jgi:hypothetical protein